MQTSIGSSDLGRLVGLTPERDTEAANLRFALRRVPGGDVLFRHGDQAHSTYVIRSGFFKSYCMRGAAEQVMAFSMTGDVVGLEGATPGVHCVEAAALTDAEVAIVPNARLVRAQRGQGFCGQLLLKLLSHEYARKCTLVSLLGYPNACARVAAFLLTQGEAFARLGYSRSSFILPMRNTDVGSYLGLRGETVCRVFAALKAEGLIDRELRSFVIKDEQGLRAMTEIDHRSGVEEQAVRFARPHTSLTPQFAVWSGL